MKIETLIREFSKSKKSIKQFCRAKKIGEHSFRKEAMATLGNERWADILSSRKTKSTPYKLGAQLERATRQALELNGWVAVRSAQSKGMIDVMAARQGRVLLIQCKRSGTLSAADRRDLITAAKQAGGVPVLISRPTGRGIFATDVSKSEVVEVKIMEYLK